MLSILVCWTGALEDGERALAPLRALATPRRRHRRPDALPGDLQVHGAPGRCRTPRRIRMMFADELSDATIDATLDAMESATSPYQHLSSSAASAAPWPASATTPPPSPTATQPYFVAIIGALARRRRGRRRARAPGPSPSGRPSATKAPASTSTSWRTKAPDRVREAYPPATYDRLAEIKRRYDPDQPLPLQPEHSAAVIKATHCRGAQPCARLKGMNAALFSRAHGCAPLQMPRQIRLSPLPQSGRGAGGEGISYRLPATGYRLVTPKSPPRTPARRSSGLVGDRDHAVDLVAS